ncbi:MAG TPA: hypothetical protein VFO55_00250 [Gemmatimonadaceae bacterium]|nr:hypothetical protein [Gemmatimonadaceae bacterium]
MPFDLRAFDLTDTIRCGTGLRRIISRATSIEEAAQGITEMLHESLEDAVTGQPSCALVRCYKTHSYGELPPDLQGFARNALGRKPASPHVKCLTLMGTTGTRPEWNSRRRSLGHQAIPLESVEMVDQAPMVSQLIRQMGLDVAAVVSPNLEILRQTEGKSYGVFYVPRAVGSPYIPAQDDFVIREQVQSVLGFGGLLRNGDLLAIIIFSRIPISENTANRFRTLALEVRASLFAAGDIPTFRSGAE